MSKGKQLKKEPQNPTTWCLKLIPWMRGRGGRKPMPALTARMLAGRAAWHNPLPPITPPAARVAMALRS